MSIVTYISSLETPGLAPYRTLRRPEEHVRDGIFVAEGYKVVRRLLVSGLSVRSILLTPEWHGQLIAGKELEKHGEVEICIAEKDLLESIVGFNLHQGIMAVARIPDQPTLPELAATSEPPCFFVALDGLVSSENVGVVVRNCSAFGVQAIVVGENSSSPYLRRAVRNSMGNVFTLPIHHTPDLRESLRFLREEHAFSIVGAHPGGQQTIAQYDFSRKTLVVLGNEGDGISEKILGECTARVSIPMMNGTDSLNVGSASAVFLYEVRRQRRPG